MDYIEAEKLYSFYVNELKNNILSFWLPRCLDSEYGGFLNCFDNRGERLVSYDKYSWSQGRFIWLFSKLATTKADIFSDKERKEFIKLASSGVKFMKNHCLMNKEYKVVFLMDRTGKPKQVYENAPFDMSIYADCFVVIGFASYSIAASDFESYIFALKLYYSIKKRILSGDFRTLPYPLSSSFRAHGIPMILLNTAEELYAASEIFDREVSNDLKTDIAQYSSDILDNFVDNKFVLHEIITKDNQFFPELLGQHQNPGHTIEDVWFHLDAMKISNDFRNKGQLLNIAKKAFENGWDREYGGLLHFCSVTGGAPTGENRGLEDEPMSMQLSGWDDKLWWIHSEALYTLLRCYIESNDFQFMDYYKKTEEYTFRTFPNPDRAIGEWIQIRKRDGRPQDKVVALPVKDPFHIARNYLKIIEMLNYELYI